MRPKTIQMFVDGQPIRPGTYSTLASFGMAETWTIAGTFYECLTWEHTRTAADAAVGKDGVSRFKGQRPQPSDGFREVHRKFKQRFP